jgi:CarD family transcriptional regulator
MAQKTKVQAKTKAPKPVAVAPKKGAIAPAAVKKIDAPAASRATTKIAASPASAGKPAKKPAAASAAAAKTAVSAPVKTQAPKLAPAAGIKKPAEGKPNLIGKPVAAKVATAPASAKVAPSPAARPVTTPVSTINKFKAASAALAKTGAAQRITAPVGGPATPKAIAEKTAAARHLSTTAPAATAPKKPVSQRHGFKTNEYIVYPAHGVGRIIGIEEQEIAGMALELFVINFDKEKLTLRVPTGKLASVGMRKLADDGIVKKAMDTLKGRARIKRTMWSRRAQEYVAKINSGDLVSIAEVVRDLYRSEAQPEQSYSERQLYEDALDRMAREIAAVEKLDGRGAVQRITDILSKSARGRRMAEDADGDDAQAA